MTDHLTASALSRWRQRPVEFIETYLYDPETGRPFKLLLAEKQFLAHAFQLNDDGRLKYPELVYGAIKKSGKTGFAALFLITVLLLFGGRYGEAYGAANAPNGAQGGVFEMASRITEPGPLRGGEPKIPQEKTTFPATAATITALAAHYASAAGGHPCISVHDELWGA